MPSPTAATSRRIAWLTLTTASVAMFSGSDRRVATSEIWRATIRISCERQIIEAIAQKKPIGTSRKSGEVHQLRRIEDVALPNRVPLDSAMPSTRTAQMTESVIAVG